MWKKIAYLVGLVILATTMTACGGKEKDFIGHWKEISAQHPFEIEIKYDEGVFHVDVDEYSVPRGGFIKTKFEAKAESNTVLSSYGEREMRLANGVLDYESREFSKLK